MKTTSTESKCRTDIGKQYRHVLRNSDRLLTFASGLIPKRDFYLYQIPGLGDREKVLSSALFCKLCREYRSVLLLGCNGYVEEAEILLRAMYEGVVTLRFLLHPKVRLVSQGRPINMKGRKPLTRKVRADLYLYHDVTDNIRKIEQYRLTPGLKRTGRRLDLTEYKQGANELRKTIGNGWASVIDKSKKLAGLTLRDLSDSLSLTNAYLTAYAHLSKGAHAKETLKYIRDVSISLGLDVRLQPDMRGIGRLLGVSDLLLFDAASLFNKAMRRGKEAEVRTLFRDLKLKERANEVSRRCS